MEAVPIKKGVYWVGAIDSDVRDFHGYNTPNGTTYNSYLVVDEKIALIDTVKAPFKDELIERVSSVVDPANIDFLVINHVEMDHSGSAMAVKKLAKNARVIATAKGKDYLHRHYPSSSTWDINTVDAGDTLELGKKTLHFIPAPMLHWPDTMFTYLKEDRILFSNDGFGQHIATPKRFFDEVGDVNIIEEAKKYYANIIMPYSRMMKRKLAELAPLDVDVICPSHGVIFRQAKEVVRIISAYSDWSGGVTNKKAIIVYDTMYSSTEKMGSAIEEGLTAEGINVRSFSLRFSDLAEIIMELLDSAAVVVGSATLNNGPMPSVGGFLTYIKGLRPTGKIGAAFGSYGWGGGAVKEISGQLQEMGFELPEEGYQARFVPSGDILGECRELGKSLAKHIKR